MKKLIIAIVLFFMPALAGATTSTGIIGRNDIGDVVGTFIPANFWPESLGYKLDINGVFTEIGPHFTTPFVNDFGVRNNATARDINNSGSIVGGWNRFSNGEPGIMQSYLYANNTYTNIDIFLAPITQGHCIDHQTTATSIDESGSVYGTYRIGDVASPCEGTGTLTGSFIWRDGTFYNTGLAGLPTLPLTLPSRQVPEPLGWIMYGLGLLALTRLFAEGL